MTNEKYRGEWLRNPALRAEFCDNYKTFAAYRDARDRGLVRMLADKKPEKSEQ